ANDVIVFKDEKFKTVQVNVKTFQDGFSGKLSLSVPENWTVMPKAKEISLPAKGSGTTALFRITPPKNQHQGVVLPKVISKGKEFSNELVVFDYPHIPKQSVLQPAKGKLVRLDIRKKGNKIAYIEGAGDVVAGSL